jgi:hypothetical protein
MIKPTIGRVVLYWPTGRKPGGQPHAALVAKVINDRLVNLGAVDELGRGYGVVSVTLLQDEDAEPVTGGFAEWMPYQKGQAAKAEQLEKQIGSGG